MVFYVSILELQALALWHDVLCIRECYFLYQISGIASYLCTPTLFSMHHSCDILSNSSFAPYRPPTHTLTRMRAASADLCQRALCAVRARGCVLLPHTAAAATRTRECRRAGTVGGGWVSDGVTMWMGQVWLSNTFLGKDKGTRLCLLW